MFSLYRKKSRDREPSKEGTGSRARNGGMLGQEGRVAGSGGEGS